jgi:hypothetical protein
MLCRTGNREDLETMEFIADFDLHLLLYLCFFLCKPAKKFVHWIQFWGRSHLRYELEILITKFPSSGLKRCMSPFSNLRTPNLKP